jgi:hypothetical protein
MSGAVAAYLHLAYNLYLLAHNVELQELLLKRLREPDQFQGAMYETFVAATFIKAGFELELEDESDPSTKHCEFSATYRDTKRKFSVEAKARQAGKSTAKSIGNQLYKALRKKAPYERIVFIDVNLPTPDEAAGLPWLKEALEALRAKENTMTIGDAPSPPAYVVLTNLPYLHDLEKTVSRLTAAAEGFKIPDFKMDTTFGGLREALDARDKHREMFHLLTSMFAHDEIPTTFDGEIPEFAFGTPGARRLLIGRRYPVPHNGASVPGTLETAAVFDTERKALGAFRLDSGECVMVSYELSDEELAAYRRHPDTFFGVVLPTARRADSIIDLFDFFMESYKSASKEHLLTFMREHPDYEELQKQSREELLRLYCQRMAEAAGRHAASGKSR